MYGFPVPRTPCSSLPAGIFRSLCRDSLHPRVMVRSSVRKCETSRTCAVMCPPSTRVPASRGLEIRVWCVITRLLNIETRLNLLLDNKIWKIQYTRPKPKYPPLKIKPGVTNVHPIKVTLQVVTRTGLPHDWQEMRRISVSPYRTGVL